MSIPEWMQTQEAYTPEADSDGYLTKSMLKVMGVLSQIRTKGSTDDLCAPLKLFAAVYCILLLSLSQHLFFMGCILALVLIRCCALPGQALVRVVRTASGAMVFSLLLMLPALWLGSPRTFWMVPGKVWLSVSMVMLLSVSTPWNQITGGLRFFRVPDLLIFTLDITIKYIAILGDCCLAVLEALRLRSVGKNHQKGKSASGVLGVTFLKSRQMAEDMHQAMVCRGFDGTYHRPYRIRFRPKDYLLLALLAGMTGLFVYLEVL
jgi:cobalt/nickel transport system permease protein